MLKEAMPSIVLGVTLTIINIIGYSAMAGTVGGRWPWRRSNKIWLL